MLDLAGMSQDLVHRPDWRHTQHRKMLAVKACTERDIEALSDLLDTYLNYKGRKGVRTSEATRRLYKVAMQDWLAYCWPVDSPAPRVTILHASEDDVEHYLMSLQSEGGHLDEDTEPLSEGSAATYLAALRAFYRALEWTGAVISSPAQDVRSPQDPRPRHERRPAVPEEDFLRLFEGLDDSAEDIRLTVMLRLTGDQGLRVGEMVALRVQDIDMSAELLHIRRAKGGKRRTIPLSRASLRALERWLPVRQQQAATGEDSVLINVGLKVKKARLGRAMHPNTVRAQLEKCYARAGLSHRYSGAHVLRHTAGTRLYRNTRDLHRVAHILGHSDINTSSIYAKMDMSGLREAFASFDEDD